jgi:hypothetical protein
MASIAGGRQRGVVVIRVALRTGNGHVGARQRERRVVVIEGRRSPRRGIVARCARSGESGRGVRRTSGAGVIRFVATVAVGRHRCVVTVHMALCAGNREMRAGQRERCVVVIE